MGDINKSRTELMDMTKDELVVYANSTFNLNVNKQFNKADLVEQIMSARGRFSGNANVKIAGEDDTVPPGHVKVRIRPNRYDKTPRPAIIGLNFKMASVPVNKDVILPAAYLSCFAYAQEDVYFQDPDTQELVRTKEYAHDYTVLEWGADTDRVRKALYAMTG